MPDFASRALTPRGRTAIISAALGLFDLFRKRRKEAAAPDGAVSARASLDAARRLAAENPGDASALTKLAIELKNAAADLCEPGGGEQASESHESERAALLAESLECFRKVAELVPNDPLAHFNLAVALEESGDIGGGIASLRRCVELDPEDALAFNHLGAVYLQAGDLARAEESLRRACELNPESAVAAHNLGVALKKLGRGRDAEHYLKRATELDPSLTQAAAELAEIRERAAAEPESGLFIKGLNRTKVKFLEWFKPFTGRDMEAGGEFYDGLFEQLVLADVSGELASELVEFVRTKAAEEGTTRASRAVEILKSRLVSILEDTEAIEPFTPGRLNVVMLVGVNGVGKTTVLAKIARLLRERGLSVLIAAADTFRAAAVDQLRIWAERTGTPMVAGQAGADPAAVVFDAAKAASARKVDVLLIDTAGRLQTKKNLMAELQKIERTIAKNAPDANVHHLLCIDANTGQNAVSQVELFKSVCRVRGLIINKLDGTARGGAILEIVRRHRLPVLFIGVGEKVTDLAEFDAREFVKGWFAEGGE
ncbi:MAG: signal recognition particle-docking protein FtsY [bacterium]|jgi:fused signal recognition particle receptor